MARIVRYGLIVIGLVQLVAALIFFFQWPLVSLWPYPGTTPLTSIFIASIFAAAAAPTLWAAITENYGALAGIGLDYVTILGPLSVYSFILGAGSGDVRMVAFAISCVVGALFGLGLLVWSAGIPIDRTTPMPGVVRWSFVIFAVLLVIVAARMILQVPTSVPWMITPQLRVVMGLMFLGAAMYFVYGLLRPSWLNAAGQYIGFLAYDLVLIPAIPISSVDDTTAVQVRHERVYGRRHRQCFAGNLLPLRLWRHAQGDMAAIEACGGARRAEVGPDGSDRLHVDPLPRLGCVTGRKWVRFVIQHAAAVYPAGKTPATSLRGPPLSRAVVRLRV